MSAKARGTGIRLHLQDDFHNCIPKMALAETLSTSAIVRKLQPEGLALSQISVLLTPVPQDYCCTQRIFLTSPFNQSSSFSTFYIILASRQMTGRIPMPSGKYSCKGVQELQVFNFLIFAVQDAHWKAGLDICFLTVTEKLSNVHRKSENKER